MGIEADKQNCQSKETCHRKMNSITKLLFFYHDLALGICLSFSIIQYGIHQGKYTPIKRKISPFLLISQQIDRTCAGKSSSFGCGAIKNKIFFYKDLSNRCNLGPMKLFCWLQIPSVSPRRCQTFSVIFVSLILQLIMCLWT